MKFVSTVLFVTVAFLITIPSTILYAANPCPPPMKKVGSGGSGTAFSVDPNALTGPAGYGPKHYVPAGTLLSYRIDFENDSAATAPAQQVNITNKLDTNLDWESFQLTEIGFGDTFLSIPPGTKTYEKTVSMTFQDVDFEVLIRAGIDPATGEVYAHFYSIDPATGATPPVNIGFLPPEDGTMRGMGHVSYIIDHAPGLPENTEIRNIALIIFDMGEEIYTNQVDPHDPTKGTDPEKEALVTIDAFRPSSSVQSIQILSDNTYLVNWSGNDSGSDVGSYDVYIRDTNEQGWDLWLQGTQETSGEFMGSPGHTYEFYSSSTDNVGYQEQKNPIPEAKVHIPGDLDTDGDGMADSLDNCPADSNPDQLDTDGDGSGNVCDSDDDNDSIVDSADNCPLMANLDQKDFDGDGMGDICDPDDDNDTLNDDADNCPFNSNPDQLDTDGDGSGNTCDSDDDNDSIIDSADNCPLMANLDQKDFDGDGAGDICDPDDDNDSLNDDADNCPFNSNPDQLDTDGDGSGNVCDSDDDNDTVLDTEDNCPLVANKDQQDTDIDGLGDVCDPDDDNDTVMDGSDNCPLLANPSQLDTDGDDLGDVCDSDDDNDLFPDTTDNCPLMVNSDQMDTDGDGLGDVCDACVRDPQNDLDSDGVCGDVDNCPSMANNDQLDFDQDGLGDVCDPQTCGNSIIETIERCDDGNLTDRDGCSAECILETTLSVDKTQLDWRDGTMRYKGDIILPAGVYPRDLQSKAHVSLSIGSHTDAIQEEISFTVFGEKEKKWGYSDKFGDVRAFTIHWREAWFDYKGSVRLTAKDLDSGNTTLKVGSEELDRPFTLVIGPVVLQFDENGKVVSSDPAVLITSEDEKSVHLQLPFSLTPEMNVSVSYQDMNGNDVHNEFTVSEYLTDATGKLELEAVFAPDVFAGQTAPLEIRLRIEIGEEGYPGYFDSTEIQSKSNEPENDKSGSNKKNK